jgi:hypothetical protein
VPTTPASGSPHTEDQRHPTIAGHCGESHSAHLPANPKVKAEYDALGSELEIAAELPRARPRRSLASRTGCPDGTSQSTIV